MIDLAERKARRAGGHLVLCTRAEHDEITEWIEAALLYLAVLLREMDAHPRQKFINKALTPEHLRSLISQIHPSPARRES